MTHHVCDCPYDMAFTCRFCLVRAEREEVAKMAREMPPAPECFYCANSGDVECDYCGTPARET